MRFARGILIATLSACLLLLALQPVSHALPASLKVVEIKVKSPEKDFPVRNVWVMTPNLPATQINLLPVVYMLHGWPGTPSGLIAGVQAPLAVAFAHGVAPFIAVFPDGNALTHSDSEWADSYDGRAMIETWLTKDVIPAVESGNIRTRKDRAILGFSMGGYGAAIIGLHHPELFGQVVTLAGYFVIDDLTNAFGSEEATDKKVIYQTPVSFLKVASQMRWFLGESSQDYTALIRGQAASWASKLKAVKATDTLSYSGGGHSYVFVGNEVPIFTKWFKWGVVTPPSSKATPTPTVSAVPITPAPVTPGKIPLL